MLIARYGIQYYCERRTGRLPEPKFLHEFSLSVADFKPGRLLPPQRRKQFQRGRCQGLGAVPNLRAPRLRILLQQRLHALPAMPVNLQQAPAQRLGQVGQGLGNGQ